MTGSLAWRRRPRFPDPELKKLNVPPLVAQVLHARGIGTQAALDALIATGPAVFSDPLSLPGMPAAVERLRAALARGEVIGIFGDFDVDGVSGTAALARCLNRLGGRVVAYLPHRVREGHGLNADAVRALKAQGASLLVTVDCGITSKYEVALARELGVDVIITDHHVPPPALPAAVALVDPRLGHGESEELSGAGLALKLAQALERACGMPPDATLCQLAALGTVADVAPLIWENRVIVREGLRGLRAHPIPGLAQLVQAAGVDPRSLDVEKLSFVVIPRLNAAGRMDAASTAYSLLMSTSVEEATAPAAALESLNRERQALADGCHKHARSLVRSWDALPPLIMVADESFSPGVIGPVASRLVEEFYRPTVLVAMSEVARASARSVPQFDMVGALSQCSEHFVRYGGHAGAAGFIAECDRVPVIQQRLQAIAAERLAGIELKPGLDIDALVSFKSLNGEALQWLRALEPCGAGNPPPVFMTRRARVMRPRVMGEGGEHLRFALQEGGVAWEAVAFRQGARIPQEGASIDAVYTIGADWWYGSEVLCLRVLDFRPSS